MKRVLLTGGTGFIGRHAIAPLLERGYEVHAVQWPPEIDTSDAVRWHRADLLDPNVPEELISRIEPTHLLHFAWYATPGAYWTSPENLRWVEASLRLVRAFTNAGGQRAVFAGTCAEYDWAHGFCSEGVTPLRPATLYGVSKHALGELVASFAAQSGLSTAWGRVFFVFGPHEHSDRLVPSVVRAFLRGEPAPTTEGRQIRDFLHVADVAAAFSSLLDSSVTGAVNVGSGEPHSVLDVVTAAAAATGRPELLRPGAIPTPPTEPPLLLADVRRLRDEVGWTPSLSLEAGLVATVEWWRDRTE
jgi:nucleoside-diphosphate-sugar epimerase